MCSATGRPERACDMCNKLLNKYRQGDGGPSTLGGGDQDDMAASDLGRPSAFSDSSFDFTPSRFDSDGRPATMEDMRVGTSPGMMNHPGDSRGAQQSDLLDAFTNGNSECDLCQTNFTFTRRRHHCRNCGCLCCGACSRHRRLVTVPSDFGGQGGRSAKEKRVCDNCQ
jgi:hypothetical protein